MVAPTLGRSPWALVVRPGACPCDRHHRPRSDHGHLLRQKLPGRTPAIVKPPHRAMARGARGARIPEKRPGPRDNRRREKEQQRDISRAVRGKRVAIPTEQRGNLPVMWTRRTYVREVVYTSRPTHLVKGGEAAPSRRTHSVAGGGRPSFLPSFLLSQQNLRSPIFIAIFLLQPRRPCKASRIAMSDTVSFALRGLPAHRRRDGLPASSSAAAVVTAEITRSTRRARSSVTQVTEDSPTYSTTHTSRPRRQLFPRPSTLDHCLRSPVCVCVPGGGNNP